MYVNARDMDGDAFSNEKQPGSFSSLIFRPSVGPGASSCSECFTFLRDVILQNAWNTRRSIALAPGTNNGTLAPVHLPEFQGTQQAIPDVRPQPSKTTPADEYNQHLKVSTVRVTQGVTHSVPIS